MAVILKFVTPLAILTTFAWSAPTLPVVNLGYVRQQAISFDVEAPFLSLALSIMSNSFSSSLESITSATSAMPPLPRETFDFSPPLPRFQSTLVALKRATLAASAPRPHTLRGRF